MLDKFLERIAEQLKPKEVRVGRVSADLLKEMDILETAHAKQHEEIKAKIEAYIDELHAQHKPECDEYKRAIADVWERMYDEVGLSDQERQDETLSVDRISGVMTKEVNDEKPFSDLFKGEEDKGGPIH